MALLPTLPDLAQLPRPTAPKDLACLYHFYTIKLSTPQEFLFEHFKTSIGASIAEKYPAERFFLTEISKLDRKHEYF